jgi:hypothetical protein
MIRKKISYLRQRVVKEVKIILRDQKGFQELEVFVKKRKIVQ